MASTYQEFTAFPKLPTELRLKIWKAALPGSRRIHVISADLNRMSGTFKIALIGEGNAIYEMVQHIPL
jgi:hypothetical protein